MENKEIELNGIKYIPKDTVIIENKVSVVEGTPFKIKGKYLIRTVTMIYTGLLEKVYNKQLVLTKCAWIADTGRWTQAVKDNDFAEVEPYPIDTEVIINSDTILDMCLIDTLPTTQK